MTWRIITFSFGRPEDQHRRAGHQARTVELDPWLYAAGELVGDFLVQLPRAGSGLTMVWCRPDRGSAARLGKLVARRVLRRISRGRGCGRASPGADSAARPTDRMDVGVGRAARSRAPLLRFLHREVLRGPPGQSHRPRRGGRADRGRRGRAGLVPAGPSLRFVQKKTLEPPVGGRAPEMDVGLRNGALQVGVAELPVDLIVAIVDPQIEPAVPGRQSVEGVSLYPTRLPPKRLPPSSAETGIAANAAMPRSTAPSFFDTFFLSNVEQQKCSTTSLIAS